MTEDQVEVFWDWMWDHDEGFQFYQHREGFPSFQDAKASLLEMLKQEIPRIENCTEEHPGGQLI